MLVPLLLLPLCSCSRQNVTEEAMEPLNGLEWFSSEEDVKTSLADAELQSERENGEGEEYQKLLDYTDVNLYDIQCELTVCCTELGMVGLNYHDTGKAQDYSTWYTRIESVYGSPTESGSGITAWYENPVGKNTAVYLFNLRDGVQVSFYASSDTPNQHEDNRKANIIYVPAPEIQSPIIPVEPEENTETIAVEETETYIENGEVAVRPVQPSPDNPPNQPGNAADVTEADTRTIETETEQGTEEEIETEEETEAPTERPKPQLTLQKLPFYSTPANGRSSMSSFRQLYEYRTAEPGQPWELVMEYGDVRYSDMQCDAVLCYTSLGLVGINLFDDESSNYDRWLQKFKSSYGTPTVSKSDYAIWENDPVGKGTMIYLFMLQDGVQISFFADDTGSELS